MAEREILGARGLILLGLMFVGTAVGVAYFGHLSSHTILDETFAAAAEAAMDVFVVGIVVGWYQRRARIREEKTAMRRELSAIREKILHASFLMAAHRSAKTWTEQTREIIMLIPRLADLQETARVSGLPIGAELEVAKNGLEQLKNEYFDKHPVVDGMSTRWDAILDTVPISRTLVVDQRSRLLTALETSIGSLKKELRS